MPRKINNCKCNERPKFERFPKTGYFELLCHYCGVGVYGTDAEEVITKWNTLQEEE